MTWHCAAYFNGAEYTYQVEASRMAEAEHAFEQRLWMDYNLTKDVARGWVIVDSESIQCND